MNLSLGGYGFSKTMCDAVKAAVAAGVVVTAATGNDGIPGDHGPPPAPVVPLGMLPDARITGLFRGVAEATEEAVLNALVAARTMTGRDGITAHQLPAAELAALLAARPSARSAAPTDLR